MAVWGALTNSCEKKRCERQKRKWKIYPFECRVQKNSKVTNYPCVKATLLDDSSIFLIWKRKRCRNSNAYLTNDMTERKCRCLKWSPISDILEVLSPPVELASEEVNNSCQFLSFLYGSLCAGPHLSKTNLLIRMLISDKVLRSQ